MNTLLTIAIAILWPVLAIVMFACFIASLLSEVRIKWVKL